MPEMKNPKHPSPHMINIPWWVYQHVWFVSSAFCRAVTSMASEPGVHSARGAAATEFIQKQMSVRVHEETAQALWPPRQLCHPKVLSRDQGAKKVPASAKFLKGLEQQHWPETPSPVPSPLGAVPSPPPSTGEMWHCPPPVPFCGHLSCTPVKRCLKFQSLPTLRAWGCWDAPPGHPSLETAGTMPGSFWGFLNLGCLTLFWKSLQVN